MAVATGSPEFETSGEEREESSTPLIKPIASSKCAGSPPVAEDGTDAKIDAIQPKGVPCPVCERVIPDGASHLTLHLRTHTGEKPFGCAFCDFRFSAKSSLIRHCRSQHHKAVTFDSTKVPRKPESERTCPRCLKVFECPRDVELHMKRTYIKLSSEDDLANHSKIVDHKTRRTNISMHLACSYCGKLHRDRYGLEQHLRKHTGERPFECECCEARFSWKASLRRHYKVVHGLKPHLGKHTGERPFECELCEMRFSWKTSLRRHYKIVHTVQYNESSKRTVGQKFECAVCNKCFSTKRNMQIHQKLMNHKSSASERARQTCVLCGKVCKTLADPSKKEPFKCSTCKSEATAKESTQFPGVSDTHCSPEEAQDNSSSTSLSSTSPQTSPDAKQELKCHICKTVFLYLSNYRRHMDSKCRRHEGPLDNAKDRTCEICNEVFHYPSTLKRHMRNKHNIMAPLTTEHVAPLTTERVAPLTTERMAPLTTERMALLTTERMAPLTTERMAPLTTERMAPLTTGTWATMNSEEDRTCATCGRVFTFLSKLKRHVESCRTAHLGSSASKNGRTCLVCGNVFDSISKLKKHKRTCTVHTASAGSADNQTCLFCGKYFEALSSLKRHMAQHTGPKPYKCPLCKLQFALRGNLNKHYLRKHSESVTPDEPQEATSISSLSTPTENSHEASPAQEDLTCPICEKTFRLLSTMKRHMIQHTGEKPFGCSICEEYFSEASALEEHHRKLHTKGRIPAKDRTCKFCGVVFSTVAKLISHSQHEEEEEESPAKKGKWSE